MKIPAWVKGNPAATDLVCAAAYIPDIQLGFSLCGGGWARVYVQAVDRDHPPEAPLALGRYSIKDGELYTSKWYIDPVEDRRSLAFIIALKYGVAMTGKRWETIDYYARELQEADLVAREEHRREQLQGRELKRKNKLQKRPLKRFIAEVVHIPSLYKDV